MAAHHPDEVGLRVLDSEEVTFAGWEAASNQFGRALQAAGVDHGDRVAIYVAADDAVRWVEAYAGVHKAGAVAVPLNTRLTPSELEALLSLNGQEFRFNNGYAIKFQVRRVEPSRGRPNGV